MKKLLALLLLATASVEASDFHSFSFLSDSISSFTVSNGISATNLTTLLQNSPATATNYGLFRYTNNAPYLGSVSNNLNTGGILTTQYQALIPGFAVIDVTTNITSSWGLPPVSGTTNSYLARTNDQVNMFKDVPVPPYLAQYATMLGSLTTNIAGTIQVTTIGTDGLGTNQMTLVFVPIPDGVNEPVDTQSAVGGLPIPIMQSFSITHTNGASVTKPFTTVFQLPYQLIAGCKTLRCRSVTASANTTNSAAVIALNFNTWYP